MPAVFNPGPAAMGFLQGLGLNRGQDTGSNEFGARSNNWPTDSSMSWSKHNDKFIAYPLTIYRDGKLIKMNPDEAYKYALSNNSFMPFDNQADVESFISAGQ